MRALFFCGILFSLAWSRFGIAQEEEAPAEPRQAAEKLPEPDASARKAAESALKEIFKGDYSKTGAADRQALARKLLQYGREEKGESAERYVCCRESADLAAKAGDFRTALEAIGDLDRSYRVDALSLKAKALEAARPSVRSAEDNQALAGEYFQLADEAVAADNYDLALALSRAASSAADKGKDDVLSSAARTREKDVAGLKGEQERVEKMKTVLSQHPGDPEASLAVGKFLCLVKGDWRQGLPLIAQRHEAALADLARKEIAAPQEPLELLALADGWWDLAAKEGEVYRIRFQIRAAAWYRSALPRLEGLSRAKVEKRLQEFSRINWSRLGVKKVYLADLQEEKSSVGVGQFGKKGDLGYKPNPRAKRNGRIRVGGLESPNGLSMHPPSQGSSYAIYRIDKKFGTLEARVAIADGGEKPPATPAVFKVYGDDRLLWKSRPAGKLGELQGVKVEISGVEMLKLEVECPGHYGSCWAVWVEPALVP
ncbi:MAG: NPCBM/NEW2 domain-containing protein [Planctomycetes bacterium]|nr:NPCBM/NEW2 domain-containing protein [Planctomycetota bacterium]